MLIHKWFEQAVDTYSDKISLRFEGEALTYLELDKRANKIAHYLIQEGVKPGDIVGLSLPRSMDLIAGMIAILKTGAAYLPLDSSYPIDRLKYMSEHAKIKHALISENFQQSFNHLPIKAFEQIDLNGFSDQRVHVDQEKINLAYVIYTSGSTGKPKGVSLGHHALVNLIEWQNKENGGLKTLQFTPISFDVHFQEIFSTLTSGGELVLVDEEIRLNPVELIKLLDSQKVERIFLPFVAFNQLADTALTLNHIPASLRHITTAGEQLKVTTAIRTFFTKNERAVLHNHYGPSETHVVSSLTLRAPSQYWDALPSIGFPIANCGLYLLDEAGQDVSSGEEGELFLGGVCLADGYLHNPEMTLERFIDHKKWGRLYRTGDLAIQKKNGEFQFLGRKDGQVKVRGYRIETGEVEVVLTRNKQIPDAAVKVIELNGDNVLCAYYVGQLREVEVRQYLKSVLPEYMVPTHFVRMTTLPLTPSGKVNYKDLPLPSTKRPDLINEFVAPRDDFEKKITQTWEKILGLSGIGVLDSFFNLGGSSLLAIKTVIELNAKFQKNLSVVSFFSAPTIEQLAKIYSGKEATQQFRKMESGQLSAPVAIVGMSGAFPEAKNIEEFWGNLLSGKNSISTFSKMEVDPAVAEVLTEDSNYKFVHGVLPGQKEFDARFFGMTPREAELMDPQQRKFLEHSVHAMESAGYFGKHDEVIGVFAGMGNSKYTRLVDQHPEKVSSVGDFNVMLGLEKDYIATRVAHKLNLTGPALSIHTGCSTSLVAIIEAVKSIRSGHCTMALAGGISISGAPNTGHLFQEGGILSRDGRCTPFDESATGTVFTEGAGVLVLKRLDKAEADGDNILAVIKGVGLNNDGADKMSFTAPSVKGQAEAIFMAQQDAKIDASTLSYIEAHGTATPVGDPIEVEALNKVFSLSTQTKNFCYLGSVKANVGHLTSAAGVAGVIKSVLILKNKTIPALTHFKKANPLLNIESSPFIINKENVVLTEQNHPLRAGVSSFGVGGTNAHIILEEYSSAKPTHKNQSSHLFKISARSLDQVKALEESLKEQLAVTDINDWGAIAFTLDQGRKNYPFRSYLVSNSLGQFAFSGHSEFKNDKPLTMMFPGQGSQYHRMGQILSQKSLLFKTHFDEACGIYQEVSGVKLQEILNHQDSNLVNQTFYTQPALFIMQYALGRTLIDLGIRPDMLIGHSVGEYVAATLAEMFSLRDGIRIISKRAELMNKVPKGAMLSVAATLEEVSTEIKSFELDIAAVNGLKSVVVAGPIEIVDKFKNYLEAKGIASVVLKTSHAFHSRMMNTVLAEFNDFVATIEIKGPTIKIIPTANTQLEITNKEYWAAHIANTVNFSPVMEKVINEFDSNFLEVGPGQVLTKLTQKIAADKKVKRSFTSTCSINVESEETALLACFGKLWSLNHQLADSRLLFESHDQRRLPAPVYPFEKKELWLESRIKKHTAQSIHTNVAPSKNEVVMPTQKKDVFAQKLVELFEESSGIEISEYGNDACFIEMGMDSLFLTQMAMQLKKEFKIQINFRQLVENFNSINALAENFVDQVQLDVPASPQNTAVASAPASMPLPSPVQVQAAPAQIQMQQRSYQSQVNVNASDLEQIIQSQLELMRSQIELLQGRPVTNTPREIISQVPQVQVAANPAPSQSSAKVEEKVIRSRGADIKTAKDSFGAAAKINVEKTAKFNPTQQANVDAFFAEYIAKTKKSKEFTQKHRQRHADPRVVTGFKPENKEIIYPVVVKQSKNQTLWDLDGNTYIDMLCGFGSNFFGNGNERIKKLVLEQLEEGIEIGPQHPLVGEVSDLICELTGNDRAAFCNTGSEAVLGAMRLARTVTGREKIVVFSGSYHGINDEVIIRGAKQKPLPAAPGINNNSVSNMVVLDYGTDEALEVIRSLADDLAAVLIEPVQSRRCDFHPTEFLKEVRKITEKSQTCLIFDEVITGFRVHPAGAQGYFGIRADLCTYGKIVGGGMPIGVISGKSEYMDALDGGFWQFGDDSTPTVGVTYFAGTFVRHPLALAAAKGSLLILKEGGEKLLRDTNDRAAAFAKELNLFCKEHQIPLEMNNFGSLMKPKWKQDVNGGELLFALLRYNGVHTYDGFPWFVNLAHTDDELKRVLNIFRKSFIKMQEMGLLENSVRINNSKSVFNANFPPHPKAKLGKDEKGNPAWFMEDESTPGSFYLYEEMND